MSDNIPPSIYIVTPCKNMASTLDATIESVVSQTVDAVVYYHIKDGVSTDGTQKKLAQWQQRLQGHAWCRFSYTSEPDAGMYDAIMRGFSAFGIHDPESFMGWINADDRLMPHSLATLCAISKQFSQIRWIGGTWTRIDSAGNVLYHSEDQWYPQQIIAHGLCDAMYWPVLQQEGIFWKKSLWDQCGGLDISLRLAGDWDLWRRMAAFAPYIHVAHPMGAFCRREGQLSGQGYLDEVRTILPDTVRRPLARWAFWHLLCVWPPPVVQHIVEKEGKLQLVVTHPLLIKRKLRCFLSAYALTACVSVYDAMKAKF